MSLTTKLFLFAAFVLVMLLLSINSKKRKKRVVFFGDSITEQGARPGGYIKLIQRFAEDEQIENKLELTGAGVGGNTISDLLQRVDKDVLLRGADIVIVYIGINDVWHQQHQITAADEQRFVADYSTLINKLHEAKIKTFLCTPTVIGELPSMQNPLDPYLDSYSQDIESLAQQHELTVVDLRKTFKEYLNEYNLNGLQAGILTADGVHLNQKGNELVAEAVWKVLREQIR